MADTTKQTPDCTKPKGLSLVSTALLGLASLGLVACSSGSSSTDTGGGGETPVLEKVSIADATVVEGDTGTQSLIFTVSLSAAVATETSVVYTTADGTAEATTDYTALTGTLTIPASVTSATITVDVSGDTDFEADETLTLTLSAPSGIALGVTTSATGTITNDDNADPTGYYNAGGATIKDPVNPVNDLVITDLQGIISGNRIMLMSINAVLMYDATITNITNETFTADVKIYYGMDTDASFGSMPKPIITTMKGTITETSQVTGIIEGTGIGTGSFSLTYSLSNRTLSASANIEQTSSSTNNRWVGPVNGSNLLIFKLDVDSAGVVTDIFGQQPAGLIFKDCEVTGTILPVASEAIYKVAFNFPSCNDGFVEGDYTGFATTKDSSHNTLVIMFSSAALSGFGELVVTPN